MPLPHFLLFFSALFVSIRILSSVWSGFYEIFLLQLETELNTNRIRWGKGVCFHTREKARFLCGELKCAEWKGGWKKTGEIWISHFISQADYSVGVLRRRKNIQTLDLLHFIFNTCLSFQLLTLSWRREKRVLTENFFRPVCGGSKNITFTVARRELEWNHENPIIEFICDCKGGKILVIITRFCAT